jgi:DNA-binding MarR family transcriptional regulator
MSTAIPKKRKFDSPEQEAYLALWRTYDRLRAIEEQLFSQWQISAQQYNVMRLLDAAHPQPIPTLTLSARLISRAPDITRMLDKLETSGYIVRGRSKAPKGDCKTARTGPSVSTGAHE